MVKYRSQTAICRNLPTLILRETEKNLIDP